LLEGKSVNLRIAEKKTYRCWRTGSHNAEFQGNDQDFPTQVSRAQQLEKRVLERSIPQLEWVDFIIEKKNGKNLKYS